LYGPSGPIWGVGDPRARELIESGIAKPDPRFVDERPPPATDRNREARPGPAHDSARYKPADNIDAINPGLMGEFSSTARELGLDQRGGHRLLELHARATKASEETYPRRLADPTGWSASFRPNTFRRRGSWSKIHR
jgi:hypothetical protein